MSDDLRPEDINPFASDIYFQDLVGEYLIEGKPEDREMRIARAKLLYEKYKGEDNVVSFKEREEDLANEPPAVKILTKYDSLNELIDGFRYEQLIVLSAQ